MPSPLHLPPLAWEPNAKALPAPPVLPAVAPNELHEVISWMRSLEERFRAIELMVNIDPTHPAQAMGILVEEPDGTTTDPSP